MHAGRSKLILQTYAATNWPLHTAWAHSLRRLHRLYFQYFHEDGVCHDRDTPSLASTWLGHLIGLRAAGTSGMSHIEQTRVPFFEFIFF